MYPGKMFRLVLVEETLNEVRDPPDCRGVLSLAGCKRPGDQRIEGAINQRISVDEKETGRFRKLHHSI